MRYPKGKVISALLGMLLLIMIKLFSPDQSFAASPQVFSAERAFEHVKYLTQKIGPRPAGSKAELKAAQYIYYTLEQSGWKVHEQPFSKVVVSNPSLQVQEQKIQLVNSQNIVAELPGKKTDTIILGAHYDTADVNAPGAIDNASGVGVLLELARILGKEPHEQTYQIIFFGAEEQGLVGSSYYTSQADLSAVSWMLNVDMVGTPIEIDVAGKKSAPPELIRQISRLARESRVAFHLSSDSMVMYRDAAQGGNSDFSSFLEQGIPAFGLGIAGRPPGFFHRPEDRIEHVSLEELQKEGEFIDLLIHSLRLEQLGPHVWDEYFLSFQIGNYVLILPSYGIRLFYLLIFLLSGWFVAKIFKMGLKVTWKELSVLTGAIFLAGFLFISLSGLGEILWSFLKSRLFIWHSYSSIFILVRIVIIVCLIVVIGSWFRKLPLPRESNIYWLIGTVSLIGVSLLIALIRIDLAFPLVFWIFMMLLEKIFPNIIFVLLGPYFIYRFHWELLNSNQWLSYYETLHRHYLIFTFLYTLLLIPMLLALLHVASINPRKWESRLRFMLRPAAGLFVFTLLFLGLVPAYTNRYPQTLTVQEEWNGGDNNQLKISSRDNFSKQLAKELQVPAGRKEISIPGLSKESPLNLEASVSEKQNQINRILDLVIQFNYARDPYLVKLKLESPRPFKITAIDEFFPMNKLPRKVQLVGKKIEQGNYVLILERTPPQRNLIKMSFDAESTMKCTVEVTFPDPDQSFRIKGNDLSVDYQALFKESIDF